MYIVSKSLNSEMSYMKRMFEEFRKSILVNTNAGQRNYCKIVNLLTVPAMGVDRFLFSNESK